MAICRNHNKAGDRGTAKERAAAVRRIKKLAARLSLRGLKAKDLISEGRR
jgi:DNA-directed RNA polymerase sigma subunit (sigma70/sigma32)